MKKNFTTQTKATKNCRKKKKLAELKKGEIVNES